MTLGELRQPGHGVDESCARLDELIEHATHRLAPDNRRFVERYVNGELQIVLEIPWGGEERYAVCQREHGVGPRIELTEGHVQPGLPQHPVTQRGAVLDGSDEDDTGGEQQPVLLPAVQLVELPEGMAVPGAVWLCSFNQLQRVLAGTLYFSAVSGFELVSLLVDRKRRGFRHGAAIRLDSLAGQVVQARATSEQGHAPRHLYALAELIARGPGFRIGVRDDDMWFTPGVVAQGGLEVTDLFFGPFDLCPRAVETMHGDSPVSVPPAALDKLEEAEQAAEKARQRVLGKGAVA